MTEQELRIALLADLDQPYDARAPGPETPRQAAVGRVTDCLGCLMVVGLLLWDGFCHGDDGQPAGTANSFSQAMAPIADLWIWAVPVLALVFWLSRSKPRRERAKDVR